MKNKIGVAVITVNRTDAFNTCCDTLPSADYSVLIQNGETYEHGRSFDDILHWPAIDSIAINKNRAIRKLLRQGCTHLFICEDDLMFTNEDLYRSYIHTAEASGIWYLNYGGHSFHNRDSADPSKVLVRNSMEYENNISVDFYKNLTHGFTYMHKSVAREVGYFNELYTNSLENYDYTYRVIKKKLHPPGAWFADAHNSHEYIHNYSNASSTRVTQDNLEWIKDTQRGVSIFTQQHGLSPQEAFNIDVTNIEINLEYLHKHYARKVL